MGEFSKHRCCSRLPHPEQRKGNKVAGIALIDILLDDRKKTCRRSSYLSFNQVGRRSQNFVLIGSSTTVNQLPSSNLLLPPSHKVI